MLLGTAGEWQDDTIEGGLSIQSWEGEKKILLLPGRGWWCRNFTKWHTFSPPHLEKRIRESWQWGIFEG